MDYEYYGSAELDDYDLELADLEKKYQSLVGGYDQNDSHWTYEWRGFYAFATVVLVVLMAVFFGLWVEGSEGKYGLLSVLCVAGLVSSMGYFHAKTGLSVLSDTIFSGI